MGRFPLTEHLYGLHGADRAPVRLVDVGCSGGVLDRWDAFGPHLHAIGFDVLEAEIERLRAAERRPHVTYEAAHVGLRPGQSDERAAYGAALPPHRRHDPDAFVRSSHRRALALAGIDKIRDWYNAGAAVRYTERRVALDDVLPRGRASVDVLKTDTDGEDFAVLLGAERVLRDGCLCVQVECLFATPLDRYANSFANVDLYLRDLGFSLFALQPICYTRAALPGPFLYDLFAQTRQGPPLLADCVYARDLAIPSYAEVFGFPFGAEEVVKLVCVLEQLGLPDCAAEVIAAHADLLPYPRHDLLDRLVPPYLGPGLTYEEYIRRFEKDPAALHASRQHGFGDRPTIAAEHIAGLDLARATSAPDWGARLSVSARGALCIDTAAVPWAYAAMLPLPRAEGSGVLAVELHVREGTVGVALMGDASESTLAGQVWLSPTGQPVDVWLAVADLSRVQSLLVRNGAPTGGRSQVEIRRARVLRS
jgi:hypothetical protein